MSTVLIIGMGDMGKRLAAALAAGGRVRRLVLAGRRGPAVEAAAVAARYPHCAAEPMAVDALRQDEVAEALSLTEPDVVVQCAAVQGPWALSDRTDHIAHGIAAAGLALRLPYQLPTVLTVMHAVRDAGFPGPVVNLSFPDVTGPVLRSFGLAPTLGLGNAGMIQQRVQSTSPTDELVRVVGHHSHVFGVMQAREPTDASLRCRVYLGEDARRDDTLAYIGPSIPPGPHYNEITTTAAVPVIEALLPGASPLRCSVPAPDGLPGGYPVRIEHGSVTLDLPHGVTVEEAVAFNEHAARGDGVERIEPDGTVHFTSACRSAISAIAPDLADPLTISDLPDRIRRLDAVIARTHQQ